MRYILEIGFFFWFKNLVRLLDLIEFVEIGIGLEVDVLLEFVIFSFFFVLVKSVGGVKCWVCFGVMISNCYKYEMELVLIFLFVLIYRL